MSVEMEAHRTAAAKYDAAWAEYEGISKWHPIRKQRAWRVQQPLWEDCRKTLAAWRESARPTPSQPKGKE